MAAPVVEVKGAEQLARAVRGIADGLEDLAPQPAAAVVLSAARAGAPRRTGRLAGSLRPRTEPGRVSVGTSVSYGWPVHSGVPSRGIVGRPFLLEAGEATTAKWEAAYAVAAQDLIDDQVRRKALTTH